MNPKKFLDKVYGLEGPDAVRGFYDDWSGSYDDEVADNGYATPARCAQALVRIATPFDTPILDFGCGTGISGQAFRDAGFTALDGVDLSAEMLAQAREKRIYRTLHQVETGAALPRGYEIISAVGVIGAGAAPPEAFDNVMDALNPGGRLVFSFNDHALAEPEYPAKLEEHLAGGGRVLFEEYGPHLPRLDLNSTVYIIEKAR